VPFDFMGLLFNQLLFSLSSLSVTNCFCLCIILVILVPAHALRCALSCFCLGSSLAHCHWLLLLDRVGVAFVERRLSLLILFIIFYKPKGINMLLLVAFLDFISDYLKSFDINVF
jgi:hypothetical protein